MPQAPRLHLHVTRDEHGRARTGQSSAHTAGKLRGSCDRCAAKTDQPYGVFVTDPSPAGTLWLRRHALASRGRCAPPS
eukprot:scaffold36016_cov129-Isochrysis_galbana.AAC.2